MIDEIKYALRSVHSTNFGKFLPAYDMIGFVSFCVCMERNANEENEEWEIVTKKNVEFTVDTRSHYDFDVQPVISQGFDVKMLTVV